jgi:hypothetical protein
VKVRIVLFPANSEEINVVRLTAKRFCLKMFAAQWMRKTGWKVLKVVYRTNGRILRNHSPHPTLPSAIALKGNNYSRAAKALK